MASAISAVSAPPAPSVSSKSSAYPIPAVVTVIIINKTNTYPFFSPLIYRSSSVDNLPFIF
jgi:hypothetical protein